MTALLSSFLSMTGAVAVSAIFVMIAHRLLKNTKTPRWMLCALWLVVLFRMACPVSFNTGASIFNLRLFHNIDAAYERAANAYVKEGRAAIEGSEEYEAALESGVKPMDVIINGNDMGFKAVYYLTDENGHMTNTPTMLEKYGEQYGGPLVIIWLAVAALLFAYCLISLAILKHKLRFAILLEDNVYETDVIKTSLVLGFISPKIYLTSGMTPQQKEVVLEHERAHIRRFDHVLKPVFYLGCCLHWFNPVCWISYLLLCTDIELACDEAVIRKFGNGIAADYGEILVSLSSGRNVTLPAVPLSFGESEIKNRIESIMKPRASTKRALGIAAAICAACVLIAGTNATNNFAPVKAAYNSQLMLEYGVGVTEADVRYLTEVESFMYGQAPIIYSDADFTDRISGSMYSDDPGLGRSVEQPVGGIYTFASDLNEGDEFFIRAPLADFKGKINPVTAVFDAQGKAQAMINGQPWMELAIEPPKVEGTPANMFKVDIKFLIDGLYPVSSMTLTLQDGRNIGIRALGMDGANDSYWFTGGTMSFDIAAMLVEPEGIYVTFREASEYIVETAEPATYWRGER